MKHIILTGMTLFSASLFVQAEVIQSVNFNPARFGQYERLKVSEKATFLGGLSAQSMRVQTAGTVTINEKPSAGQNRLAYDILKLDATKGFTSLGDTFPSDPTLSFPNTCFGSSDACLTSTDTGALSVSFQEGKARFQAPASYTESASRINQITTQADQLRMEAVYATIKGKLNVTGNGAYSYRNLNTPSAPLRLAGNWIPLPATSGAPTGATLKWENRKTVKYADHGGETVRILVLDGGSSGGCSPTNGNSYTVNCPSGQTGTITYTWNQAQCKYVQTGNTCQSDSLAWSSSTLDSSCYQIWCYPELMNCSFDSNDNVTWGSGPCPLEDIATPVNLQLLRKGLARCADNVYDGAACTKAGEKCWGGRYYMSGHSSSMGQNYTECCGSMLLYTCR